MSLSRNLYFHPEKSGMTVVSSIDWSTENYEFDLTVVWFKDGTYMYGEDAGCSCPEEFGDHVLESLIPIRTKQDKARFKEHLHSRSRNAAYDSSVYAERIVGMLSRIEL